ncbi:crotonobetainyl-CoA:carnitine CoA-transferase CaiB-like acyl-CoA transferase [Kitasatospora sp. MAA19]|uniref:CaiB/BaiF CoA transferase family protein n=1 Tax=Kitasatospora sp. MAA19 TaxID=3035090 RepID=UPI002475436D|nr:CoA transferase [Kitasatospora sp. MAA19]MDH6709659.1 crotonobetainyl-CoA:carnitine CoA-transferase CaiB-like acyl-CoA transferase [Kitasatospora sp. MAA19]
MTGLPLAGLLVADFGRVLAAPYLTMLLADLGADVIKVEQPGTGDDTRSWGPPHAQGEATYFLSVNRNKRSLTLDLRDPADHARAVELVRRADILVENFRPGTMDRHGLGHERARVLNPGLVYCSITGFGAGPGAALPGYDLLVQAVGGLMSVTGPAPGEPVKTGVALVDVLTGLHAAVGVLAALREREATGQGQLVELNLLSTLLSGLVNQSAGYTLAGTVPGILGNRHPSIAPYEVFTAADRPLVVAVGNDRQFAALCRGLDAPALATDPRFATNGDRVAHVDALRTELTARLERRTAAEWFAVLTPLGVPCGPVNDLAGAFALADSLGLAPRATLPGPDGRPLALVANPIGLSRTPPRYHLPPPRLGEHTAELTAWLDTEDPGRRPGGPAARPGTPAARPDRPGGQPTRPDQHPEDHP